MAGGMTYTSELVWDAGKVSQKVANGGARGCTRATEFLRSESVPLAPLDMGPLRASAQVIPAVATALLPEAKLVFDTPYAAAQHERLDYHHDQGQAKYVEDPARRHAGTMAAMIAADIRREVES